MNSVLFPQLIVKDEVRSCASNVIVMSGSGHQEDDMVAAKLPHYSRLLYMTTGLLLLSSVCLMSEALMSDVRQKLLVFLFPK